MQRAKVLGERLSIATRMRAYAKITHVLALRGATSALAVIAAAAKAARK